MRQWNKPYGLRLLIRFRGTGSFDLSRLAKRQQYTYTNQEIQ